jgi:hypothetical protein
MSVREIPSYVGPMAIFLRSARSNEPFAGYADNAKVYRLNSRPHLIHFQCLAQLCPTTLFAEF